MKRLGELLLERGAVTVDELQTALDAVMRKGGRLGTHLLRYGFVTEGHLLEALADQFGVPAVAEATVLAASEEVRRIIPQEVGQRYSTVAFAATADRLDVATLNPKDPETRAAIQRIADPRAVRWFVTTEKAIRKAVGNGSGAIPRRTPKPRPAQDVLATKEAWEAFWKIPPIPAQAVSGLTPEPRPPGEIHTVRFPELTPLPISGHGLPPTLDAGAFVARLAETTERDQVADLLCRYLHTYMARVALFMVHTNRVVGWTGRGEGVVVEDLQSLILPLDRPSLLLNLLHTGEYYRGPIPPGEANRVLIDALGKPSPQEVLALPIRLRGRAVVFALGDNPGQPLGDPPVREIVSTCNRAAIAFEILILRAKLRE